MGGGGTGKSRRETVIGIYYVRKKVVLIKEKNVLKERI